MKRLLLSGSCLLLVVGCQLTVDPNSRNDKHDPAPVVIERATAADLWISLAHAIESKSITTTNRMAQVIVVLARNGDLSSADVAAFDAAFPGATKKANDRNLTDTDITVLKSLGGERPRRQ